MAMSTATTTTSDTSSKTQSHGLMATVRYVQGLPVLACMASLMIISVVLGAALLIYMLLWPSDNPKHAALRPTVTPDDDNTTMNGTVEASPVASAVSDGVAIEARRHTATFLSTSARLPSSSRGGSTRGATDPPDSVVLANGTSGIPDLHGVARVDANWSHTQREIAMMETLIDLGVLSDVVESPGPVDNGTTFVNSSHDAALVSSTSTRRDDNILLGVDLEKPSLLERSKRTEFGGTGTHITMEREVNLAESNARFYYTNTTDTSIYCIASICVPANVSEEENLIGSRANRHGEVPPGHTARPAHVTHLDHPGTGTDVQTASGASSLVQNRSEGAAYGQ
ncbi:hypothetical protein MRX96_041421 [Rhipicephalus microplus]